MVSSDQTQLHRRAHASQAEGAIVAELSGARELLGMARLLHIGLALATLLASWLFTQVMFALHAHAYRAALARGEKCGLIFPDTEQPDYLDFLYFSIVIGTSGQTAEVSFASGPMINVASSLL